MTTWQSDLVRSLSRHLPEARIEPYGSVAEGSAIDGGSDLIGLHLCLGIVRQALALRMEERDRATGHTHHREATPHDRDARRLLDVLSEHVGPPTALRAYRAYAESRALVEPGYAADPRGLEAVIRRGLEAA